MSRPFPVLSVLAVAVLAGCQDRGASASPGVPRPGASSAPAEVRPNGGDARRGQEPSAGPRFKDVAAESGIDFRFFADVVPGRYFLPETMGGGIGWTDFDLDGRLDLCAANGRPLMLGAEDAGRAGTLPRMGNRMFRQARAGSFRDVAASAGADVEAYGQGVTVGDYDADGFDDLFLSSYGDDALLRNNGDGTFADATAEAGTTDPLWSTSGAWLDVNGDRLLDLYVVNYMNVTPETHKVCDYDGKRGYCGPGSYDGVQDVVYLNRGEGGFAPAAAELGFASAPPGKGLAVVAGDLDDDLVPEIYVGNDMEPNFLFTRDASAGQIVYREAAGASGCAVSGDGMNEASMGAACADFDGDSRPDLYLTHYYHTKNTLYRNLGGLLFEDQSRRSGIAAATHERLGFGTVAADFDRDGDTDLFMANGHVFGPEQPPFEMEPGLLTNDGHGKFADASASAGPYFAEKMLGRGAGGADYDDDGDVDLAVSHIDRPLALLRNDSRPAGRFVGIELASKDRVPPVGGRVRVEAGGRSWTVPVLAGGSYLSSGDRRILVGLGEAGSGPVSVEVHWPSGEMTRLDGLEPDAYWRIDERGGRPERRGPPGRRADEA